MGDWYQRNKGKLLGVLAGFSFPFSAPGIFIAEGMGLLAGSVSDYKKKNRLQKAHDLINGSYTGSVSLKNKDLRKYFRFKDDSGNIVDISRGWKKNRLIKDSDGDYKLFRKGRFPYSGVEEIDLSEVDLFSPHEHSKGGTRRGGLEQRIRSSNEIRDAIKKANNTPIGGGLGGSSSDDTSDELIDYARELGELAEKYKNASSPAEETTIKNEAEQLRDDYISKFPDDEPAIRGFFNNGGVW